MFERIPEPPIEPPYQEDSAVYTCSWCGCPICEGETYAEINGNYYHESCLDNEMPVCSLLSMFDVDIMEAVRS